MRRRVAVVDTGTNSTRLMVADYDEGRLKEVVRKTAVTRLGEGVSGSGCLSAEAMDRVRSCFLSYRDVINSLKAEAAIVLATSSVRDASNGEEFIASLAREGTMEYRILSGGEEAKLSFAGASMGQPENMRITMVDVGGGSTEIASGIAGEADYSVSLDLGCVRLTERYLADDPPHPDQLQKAEHHVREMLAQEVEFDGPEGPGRMVAVAGTATSLAALDMGLEVYDRDAVHGHIISTTRMNELYMQLAGMTNDRRVELNMPPGRADIIVAGTLILLNIAAGAGAEEVQVSEKDILDGAALVLIREEL